MSNLHILPHGCEFELILAKKDGNMPTARELDKLEVFLAEFFPLIDYEFSRWYKEIQSPVYYQVDGFRDFVRQLKYLCNRFESETEYLLIPFSGIFDRELSEEFVSYVAGRDYYQQAWQMMRPDNITGSDIMFNKVGATHISLAISEQDVIRMFNLANLLITPLTAISSCYGGEGHCLRGVYWPKIHPTVRPLYIQSVAEYNGIMDAEGVSFTQGAKGWPWVRIKDDISNLDQNNGKLYRLELGFLDMMFNLEFIANISEFIVRLMSIFHYDLPGFVVETFDPKLIQAQYNMMCRTKNDWKLMPTINLEGKAVTVREFMIRLINLVDEHHDGPECSDFVRGIVTGKKLTCSEALKKKFISLPPATQSDIRLHCYQEFMQS